MGLSFHARLYMLSYCSIISLQKENVMTVPNLLTVSRMALSPAIGYLVLMESYALACGIFVFVGVTDIVSIL